MGKKNSKDKRVHVIWHDGDPSSVLFFFPVFGDKDGRDDQKPWRRGVWLDWLSPSSCFLSTSTLSLTDTVWQAGCLHSYTPICPLVFDACPCGRKANTGLMIRGVSGDSGGGVSGRRELGPPVYCDDYTNKCFIFFSLETIEIELYPKKHENTFEGGFWMCHCILYLEHLSSIVWFAYSVATPLLMMAYSSLCSPVQLVYRAC